MVAQPDGPAVKMAARPVVTWSKRAGASPSTSTAPAAQLPAKSMLTVAVSCGAGQPRLGAQGTVDEGDAAGAVRVGRPVRYERPAVLDQFNWSTVMSRAPFKKADCRPLPPAAAEDRRERSSRRNLAAPVYRTPREGPVFYGTRSGSSRH